MPQKVLNLGLDNDSKSHWKKAKWNLVLLEEGQHSLFVLKRCNDLKLVTRALETTEFN